jgi:hypothetical protein
MGLDFPGPGNFALQRRFLVSLHSVGVLAESVLRPEPFSPRKRDQLAAAAVACRRLASMSTARGAFRRVMIGLLGSRYVLSENRPRINPGARW